MGQVKVWNNIEIATSYHTLTKKWLQDTKEFPDKCKCGAYAKGFWNTSPIFSVSIDICINNPYFQKEIEVSPLTDALPRSNIYSSVLFEMS